MNDNKEASQHYLAESGAAYASGSYWEDLEHPFFAYEAAYFSSFLKPHYTILDFGCGNGGLLHQLKDQVASAEGIEVNPKSAAVARKTGCVIHESLSALENDQLFDLIYSNHVLEHVRDVCGTLEMLQRRLKPSGIIILKLPLDDFRTPHQRTWQDADLDHHLQTWTPRLIANTLRETGFVPQEVRVVTSALHPKLLPLKRLGLERLAFRAFAMLKRRRQIFAVAKKAS